MLDIKFIRENPEKVKEGIKNKNAEVDIDKLLELDKRRRELIAEIDNLRAEQNKKSKGPTAHGYGAGPQDPVALEELKSLKERIKVLENEFEVVENDFNKILFEVPNLPLADVKPGKDETENEIIKIWGKIPKFDFELKDHLELGEGLDIIDVERAAKVSGTRFGYLKNEAVFLEFALVQLALEVLTKEKFIPVVPPVLINLPITKGLGYWQAGGHEDYYWVNAGEKDEGFYLVGTAEHSIVPMHKDEVLDKKNLPLRYVGFSTSFRREAGSYGKDTRGILRVHQFDKVEMVSFVTEDKNIEEHEYLLSLEEKLFQKLNIPYQVVKMCTADLGFPAARKYDLEAWMPGQNKYREVTSTSTTTDFQARRLNIKYRDGNENKFANVLNGTAFAIGRTIIAILENYQTKNGTVKIPKALQKYMFGVKEIT